MCMISNSHESFSCIISEFWIAVEEITHAPYLPSTDTTTGWWSWASPKSSCFVDDNRIGIEEGFHFDDGRREEGYYCIPSLNSMMVVFRLHQMGAAMRDDDFALALWLILLRIGSVLMVLWTKILATPEPAPLWWRFTNRLVIASNCGLNWFFPVGGVPRIEKCLTPEWCEVERARESVLQRLQCINACFEVHDFLFIRHPNLCSSSTTTQDRRSANLISGERSLFVPTTQWIVPSLSHLRTVEVSFVVLIREQCDIDAKKALIVHELTHSARMRGPRVGSEKIVCLLLRCARYTACRRLLFCQIRHHPRGVDPSDARTTCLPW